MHTFHFNSYELDKENVLSFFYKYTDENNTIIGTFVEAFRLPQRVQLDPNDPTVAKILKHLHIIVGISYYKSLLGDVHHDYTVTNSEADYYNDVYDNGLGEYAFINKYTEPIRPFNATSDSVVNPVDLDTDGVIMGVGGGKDSIVAGEIFKHLGISTTTMDIATRDHHGQAGKVMDTMGLPQLEVNRYIDRSIVDFTEQYQGKSGHIPLSTIIAWVGVLLAYATKTRYVAMANEGATSAGNATWNGREVNHQWAKSLESERLTQTFIARHVTPDIQYISPIRPYGSLVIMELLAKLGEPYLHEFTSCNLVLRIDPTSRPNGRWCTRCAKCLSTWLLLSSWMDTDKLVDIFGRNLWIDSSLRNTLELLLGLQGHKPLDCVGTIEELRAVTRKAIERGNNYPLLDGISSKNIPGPSIDQLVSDRTEHNMPAQLAADIETLVSSLIG